MSSVWLNEFLGLLLPQDCLLCGAPVSKEPHPICQACSASLTRLPPDHCPICALPTPRGEVCGTCLHHPPAFDTTLAPFIYAFPADKLIQALKYRHQLALPGWLGVEMARVLDRQVGGDDRPDFILPMPLHPDRLAARGFNQAMELARVVGRLTGLAVRAEAATRSRNAVPQASLPWKERRKNIRGAFSVPGDLTGLAILVLDDVMTTGATLDELARCLKAAGASRVSNLVAARTLPHGG